VRYWNKERRLESKPAKGSYRTGSEKQQIPSPQGSLGLSARTKDLIRSEYKNLARALKRSGGKGRTLRFHWWVSIPGEEEVETPMKGNRSEYENSQSTGVLLGRRRLDSSRRH